MTKDPEARLKELRADIDALDDQIIDLFYKRIDVVKQVGAMKTEHFGKQCHIRSGREGDMVRDIYHRFDNTDFHPVCAVNIWRQIISASTHMESPLSVSVLLDNSASLYWQAREYFGNYVPTTTQPTAGRVISDLLEDKAMIGVLPQPSMEEDQSWWPHLCTSEAKDLRIFACIPFIQTTNHRLTHPYGFAIAKLKCEPGEEDISCFGLQVSSDVSTSRLHSLFEEVKLNAVWRHMDMQNNLRRIFLTIDGFIDENNESIKTLEDKLGDALYGINYLGTYPAPLHFKDIVKNERAS